MRKRTEESTHEPIKICRGCGRQRERKREIESAISRERENECEGEASCWTRSKADRHMGYANLVFYFALFSHVCVRVSVCA